MKWIRCNKSSQKFQILNIPKYGTLQLGLALIKIDRNNEIIKDYKK